MLRNFTERNSRNLITIFLFFHLNGNYDIRIGTRQDRYVSMREFSNHAVSSMSDSTMAVSSKYTQDLSVQIVFFTFSCKWFLCFYFLAVIWSYIVDLFAALDELASASARTLLKLASSVRKLLKPYGATLRTAQLHKVFKITQAQTPLLQVEFRAIIEPFSYILLNGSKRNAILSRT